jgi:predicted nucleic acid-binding protein
MLVLADTNILLRSLHPEHHHYPIAQNAIATLRRGNVLCIASQNLVEFWAVSTRPDDENGLGMTHARAAEEIRKLRRFFRLLPPCSGVLDIWQRMVLDLSVTGKQTHDAHLAATIRFYSVDAIVTFNVRDFGRYGITVIDPSQV